MKRKDIIEILGEKGPGLFFSQPIAILNNKYIKDMYSMFDNRKLYHYTDLNGLLGIVQSNGLWLSEAKYLNDKEELINGKKLTIDLINYLLKNKSKYAIFREVLMGVINKLETNTFSNNYVCSFSLKEDDLDQWRAYGDRGSGICIEFTRDKEKYSLFETFNFMRFCNVIYNDEIKYKILHSCIFTYYYYFLHDKRYGNKIDTEDYINSITLNLIRNYLVFKNKSFESEQEVRLVYEDDPLEKKDFKNKYFRNSNGILVPYIKINDALIHKDGKNIADIEKLPISKVIVGPTTNQEITYQSIQEFLDFNGYQKNIVKKSNIPYR